MVKRLEPEGGVEALFRFGVFVLPRIFVGKSLVPLFFVFLAHSRPLLFIELAILVGIVLFEHFLADGFLFLRHPVLGFGRVNGQGDRKNNSD